ncbi:glucose-1-phosphate adenylyltransferase subunit GlgD [Caldisalinibacter kiritimatiensis]|uniref:Glycogen biosynthesis protein GlgD, glucose-1-phosphate adenylyltransferase family n=1 Tax=Caldisalinibacter kiritimatiensis TaxID=1304284 RepID=R1ATY4_9FIRM|nr:glucose-1-phosphate adenylyltransferase subunit GlgD [Caldisalinibacter kiritimatiensis]EOD00598.1 Glycogen biosynthesis protein GlgD, glucose-1-phosphate adenylyltransferase family [Caldisalinibacter kiritimatiensis]
MKDLMGIINLSESEEDIKELTYNRPIASIPIAGRYRVIDFVLSNMVNAGIENVSIFTQGKSRSLMDHIKTGKDWDLDRKLDGLFILNPQMNTSNMSITNGDIDNFENHMVYLERSRQNYVILTRSYMICNIDYSDVYRYHKESGADITIVYKKVIKDSNRFINCDTLNLDKDGKVISLGKNIGNDKANNISLEMYVMKKELLLDIIKNSITKGDHRYLKQSIFSNIDKFYVNSYKYNGYLACINSIRNYYKANMELLYENIYKKLFYDNGLIYTRIKDEPPTIYSEESNVYNSLVANGCVIEGTVKNSIIFRGVKIKKNTVVENSIIMQKSEIDEGVKLKNVILDKNVVITKNNSLQGYKHNPLVIKKNEKI